MAILRVIRGPSSGSVYELQPGKTLLGRDATCDVVLPHDAVSRRHATIEWFGDAAYIEDHCSRNGTAVNGQLLPRGPKGRQQLRNYDWIEIDGYCFVFEDDPTSDSRVIVTAGEVDTTTAFDSALDVSSDSARQRWASQSASMLQASLAIIEEVAGVLDLRDVFPRILDCLLDSFEQAQCGFILLRDSADAPFATVAVKRRDGKRGTIRASRTIIDYVAEHKKAILSVNASGDDRFAESSSVGELDLRCLLCAPLLQRDGEPFGIIQLEVIDGGRLFTEEDLEVFAGVMGHLSMAIENAKHLDAAVREQAIQQQRLRTVIDYAPEAIVVLDADTGRFVDANENAVRLYGLEREQLFRVGPFELSPPTQPDGRPSEQAARERIQAALAGEVPVFEWTHRNAQGALVPCEVRLVRLPARDRNLVRGSVTDITERKRAEAALRASELRLRLMVEQLPAVLWTTDHQLRLTSTQGAALQSVGIKPKEVIGRSLYELIGTGDAEHPVIARHLEALQGRSANATHRWAGRVYEGRVEPLYDPEGQIVGTIGIAQDVTERTEAEEELRRAYDELERRIQQRTAELARSNKELERFAYAVSHDLQEPLRSVTGFCDLLRRRYQGRLDATADQFISYAVEAASRMQALIRDLLQYSRVTTGAPELAVVDCQSVFGEAVANLRAAINQSGARVAQHGLPKVQGVRTQLVQLFQNLIANAIKFRSQEPPRVDVRSTDLEDHVQIEVRDNGIGIDPEHAERIFAIFQQLHGRGEYPGTGVGLAICKKVVERHGGRIWVQSKPGRGAAFFFTLPKPAGGDAGAA